MKNITSTTAAAFVLFVGFTTTWAADTATIPGHDNGLTRALQPVNASSGVEVAKPDTNPFETGVPSRDGLKVAPLPCPSCSFVPPRPGTDDEDDWFHTSGVNITCDGKCAGDDWESRM